MAFNYDEYLRTDKMPTLWCWGCGDGVILKALIRAIDKLGWNMDDVCVVSGIGCSGRFSSYINCNTVHTTHGRTLPYATGIKMANPNKKVIVVGGDGDGLAIGGNHTIHAARRNIDLTYILINNFIYGLTNSQTSPTTPKGMWTATMERGNIDPTFDSCKLVEAAGASFVARETMIDPKKLERTLVKALEHKGFSYLEVFSNCHVNLGRKNKMASATANLEWIDSISLAKTKFDMLEESQKDGKYPTGVLKQDENALEYCEAYEKVKEAHKNKTMVEL
ncbi:MAG: 2-oxoglutarate ferredoxin oxidoreductase subunit beta [Aliarcobacter sp.]|mgnify:FL=1|jgi:2-oxoglutarate ferredoxin oxidoreductase subunit beta|uniref:2-oxoglutarate ferredoxin oxidoreductase subunit beta n=2 Tax=Aliarcobacter cryaerophilus TaxID=28198 RepID=A0A2S9TCS0_9BACT|nr:2-oxoglutarate ferredoxin oxidoreductase subunit beta [Aliarcobacter cryaerophilus]AYJ80201.1 2-oxoglutarate:acceptor oxidoreductase, beta subunit [Aliarcobacter cryaerophilus ATCC 43158]PRM96628.1 2-oxoglutarate ferredoxin oxidoreductase subunit beta [Arcobacter cryaerophilus gv. crypticus]PRM97838.1 2-oxoglutarate ferredoxin oxidoreductase subunit beta [Aliarcobacter cryaerophilus]QCZ24420.1 2-oxoglutarate ferredoxin oxidoreductase subunit beta [Aliarcobacter cryaerophilus ATCC 43158]